jgi:sugar phosphate isomerase/epimerase
MNTRRQFLGSLSAALAATATRGESPAVPPSGSAPSSPWQLGCYTRPWAAHDYRVALDGIAAAGFQYAGLMTTKSKNNLILSVDSTPDEAAAVGAEVARRGLKAISLWGGNFPLDKADGLKRLIDNAAACGCPHLLLGGTDEKKADAYYAIVAGCCDYAAEKKVGLSVKPHGGNNANGAQCRKHIDRINHTSFRLWYDPGNIFYYSDGALDPVNDAASVDGTVVGMSVKDFLPPKKVDLTPGTGQVNFAKVLARLKQGGFTRGPLVVECLTPGDLPNLTAEAVKARQLLTTLTA